MKKGKLFVWQTACIVLGSFLLALGINVFLTPNKISSGGISSIGTILLYAFDVKMSVTNIALNALLFLLGAKYLGRGAVAKTVIGIVALTASLEITGYLPAFSEDMILATVVGGVLVGLGVGLVVRQNASTGGSDFAALVIKRFLPHVSLATIILFIDCAVIITAGIVFKSVTVTIYSVIAMYVSSRVTDAVVVMGNKAKAVQIFSEKSEEIADYVLERFMRGVTGIHCRGMYSGREKMMLLCVVSPKEMSLLISAVKRIDRSAFVIINDAKEVLGEGFKMSSDYDTVGEGKRPRPRVK